MRGDRLNERLAEKERDADAELHHRDADCNVVYLGIFAYPSVEKAEANARAHRGEHAEPGRAAQVGDAIGNHRAEYQRALQTEINAAGPLGDGFSE